MKSKKTSSVEFLEKMGTDKAFTIQHKFVIIDLTGNSSFVKMEIYEDSKHIYTDYFGLYKFEDGWKIVNKIFYGHE